MRASRWIVACAATLAVAGAAPSTHASWRVLEPSAGGLTTSIARQGEEGVERKHMLLGTDVGGLYRTTDEARSWERARTWIVDDASSGSVRVANSMYVASVYFHPERPNVAFALVGDGVSGGLLQSDDGGETWSLASSAVTGDANGFRSALWAPTSPHPTTGEPRSAPRWPRAIGKLLQVDAGRDLLYVGTFGKGLRRFALSPATGTITTPHDGPEADGVPVVDATGEATPKYITGVALDDIDAGTVYFAGRRDKAATGDAVVGDSSLWRGVTTGSGPTASTEVIALRGLPNGTQTTEQLVAEELAVLNGRLYAVANPADAAIAGAPRPGLYWLGNARTAAATNNFAWRDPWLGQPGETWSALEAQAGRLGTTKVADRVLVGKDAGAPLLTITGVPTLSNIPPDTAVPPETSLTDRRSARAPHPLDGIDYNFPQPSVPVSTYQSGIYWHESGVGDIAGSKMTLFNAVGGPAVSPPPTPGHYWQYGTEPSNAAWLTQWQALGARAPLLADEEFSTCRFGAAPGTRLSAFTFAGSDLERIAVAGSCTPMVRFSDVRTVANSEDPAKTAIGEFWYPAPNGIGLLVGTNLQQDPNDDGASWMSVMDWRLMHLSAGGTAARPVEIAGPGGSPEPLEAPVGYAVAATSDPTATKRLCAGLGHRDKNEYGTVWCTSDPDGAAPWSETPPFAGATRKWSGRPRGLAFSETDQLVAAVQGKGLQRLVETSPGVSAWQVVASHASGFVVNGTPVRFEQRADGQVYAWSPSAGLWRGSPDGASWVKLSLARPDDSVIALGKPGATDPGSLVVLDRGPGCADVFVTRQRRGGEDQEGLRVVRDCGQSTAAAPASQTVPATDWAYAVMPASPNEGLSARKVAAITEDGGALVLAVTDSAAGAGAPSPARLWRGTPDPLALGGMSWSQASESTNGAFGQVADEVQTLVPAGGEIQALTTGGVAGGPATP